jgi:PAS domain S-box-containing protein
MSRILIADDNPDSLYMLEIVLKSSGYEATSAKDGAEALALALDNPPDVIVTDILMPEMDGFELCRRWKADKLLQRIPFVFYTATYTDLKDEQFALSLGADRFVIKPQQPEVLVQIVQEVLAKPPNAGRGLRKLSPADEKEVLQRYNEVLFRKLQQKVIQLENVIAKQKITENELRESERKYRTLITQSPDGIFIVNLKGTFLAVNRIMCESMKYSEEELLSMSIWDIVPEQYMELHKKRITDILMGKAPNTAAEYKVRGKDGNLRQVEILSAPYYEGKELIGFQGIARDITERKKAEELLRTSEQKYRQLYESLMDAFAAVDMQGKITEFNEVFSKMIGYPPDEIYQLNYTDLTPQKWHAFEAEIIEQQVMARGYSDVYEKEYVRKDGTVFPVELRANLLCDELGNPCGMWAVVRDITERKKAEDAIIRSKLLLQDVIDSVPDWINVKDFGHKYLLVNKSFAEAQNINPQNMIGRADSEFFSEELCLGNADKGIIGYHTYDKQAFEGHILHNPSNIVNWADGTQHTYDTYRIPLTDQSGQVYGALIYSRDISQQVKAEQEREAAYESLQRSLHNVIDTMAKVVEMRDPYTAGHQQRVSDLAGAIAREMNLDDSRVEHLIMAAKIHDIGKMFIPSEILSKPGKLTDIEFSLIKTHAKGSFDIIRDIEFARPVALMTLQHHERLDGSGYPNGLKGDAMMTESKILAVADVIEAMASYRPYRPALGIEIALEEISRNRGKLYDPDVVDACLKLFTEKGFRF